MRFVLSFFILGFTHIVYAAESKEISSLSNEPIGAGNYIQMFFGLFIIVALIFGMAWFMRRMGKMSGMSAGDLKVLGGISVGQRERVVLVQAGETQLLVGVAPGSIRTLHILDEPVLSSQSSGVNESSGFANKLHAAIKTRGKL